MDLSGKIALVTGGGQGLGGTIALALAKAGADVAISYNSSADKANSVVDEIEGLGRRAVAFRADVGRTSDCLELAAKAVAWQGRCDIFVSNAGMGQGNGLQRTSDEEWDRVMAVNVKATFTLAKALLPTMIEQKFGRVITMSSNVGVVSQC
eukprot:SAG22_NODE_3626_length_1607_cov_2.303714_1_plen_151_part_00